MASDSLSLPRSVWVVLCDRMRDQALSAVFLFYVSQGLLNGLGRQVEILVGMAVTDIPMMVGG